MHAVALRAGFLAFALLLAACGGGREAFVDDRYDAASSDRLFTEAFGHLADNYIEVVNFRDISVAGLNALAEFDEKVRATASDNGGYALEVDGAQPAAFKPPRGGDPRGWARQLSQAVATARASSPGVGAAEPDAIYTAVLTGVTGQLDAFSRYEPPKRASESRARREGYGGIGVTISDVDDQTVIQEVMPETPAEAAGLETGDVITHADGVALKSLPKEDRAERLRGPIGATVAVSIFRQGVAPFTVNIRREEIVPTTVYFERDKDLPRFRITSFSRNTADSLAAAIAAADYETGGLDGIVLDLRGNPGGYLTQAIEVADLFLEGGVVVSTHGRHPSSSNAYRASAGVVAEGKPLILLIDGRSASASELLAAALVDAGRAVAVGSVTYGKGSIQNLDELANGGELIVTWSRMHAPSGYLLDGLGVRPTVCTSYAKGGETPDMMLRHAAHDAGQALTWRAYVKPDKTAADQLRALCPKVDAGGDADLDVARLLLRDRNAYEATLSPSAPPARHAWAPKSVWLHGENG